MPLVESISLFAEEELWLDGHGQSVTPCVLNVGLLYLTLPVEF